jgi:ATP-dependent exoDNAse (exonuclease V) beta subunit
MHNFVVYKSSAGSGKTFTLVKEYLRLSLHDGSRLYSNYKKILAITFTNKAAAEMKQRVIDALGQIALKETMPVVGEILCRELNISTEELKKRAGIVLSNILHHYSDFSIGTIDSFTHKIVKTFAHDLKLPVNFNVELDTQGFYEKVISTLFSQVGEDEYVSRLLREYALTRAEENTGWDPEQHIQEFSKLLLKENSGDYIDRLRKFSATELEEFRKQFLDFMKEYKATLRQKAGEAISLIKKQNLTDDDFIYKKTGPQSFFLKCMNSTPAPGDISSRFLSAISGGKWSGNSSAAAEAAISAITPQLNTIGKELAEYISTGHQYYSLCETLARQMYPLMLLKKIEEISAEQKQEERLVFISEFNQKIFSLINNEPTPFIYERLGERYNHYLVDEFQDTSSLQWQNILPLIDNSLSNGWFNLIVGDGKQSIYRWRNANVRQFAALPEIENPSLNPHIAERALSLKRNFGAQLLKTNFRSLKTIIDFNNALFGSLSGKLLSGDHSTIYGEQEQEARNQETGYITVHLERRDREELDECNFSQVKDHIEKALESGFSYKDICILCRYNFQGNLIAGYLVSKKIPIVSSDSLLLKNSAEVNAILCYLAWLLNRSDMISAAAVMGYLFQSEQISETEFHGSMKQLAAGKNLFSVLQSVNIDLEEDRLSLNNLLDTCIRIINALNLNRRGYHYTRFFLDEVNEFLVLKNSDINGFLEWWQSRSQRASLIIPDSTDAVKIMTIHASKGLEFPVVIVPFCNWGIYRAGDSWVEVHHEKVKLPVSVVHLSKRAADSGFDKELDTEQQEQVLDNLNLLYVAFTRAVERLHVIATVSEGNKLASVSQWLEAFMTERHTVNETGFYSVGQPGRKLAEPSHPALQAYKLQPLGFDTARDTIRIKSSWLLNSDVENAKQQGLVLHLVLSKIKSAGDIDAAFNAAILEGALTGESVTELRPRLEALITHPLLENYFKSGAHVRIESELAIPGGEILRPDRIIFQEEETVLIDYKTGRENNEKYAKQLHRYSQALHSMGHKKIKKLLVYTDNLKVIEVN